MTFIVNPVRLAKAQELFTTKAPSLGEIPLIEVLMELNLDEYVSFGESGNLKFDLTPLQWVALAAAVVAVAEAGGKKEAETKASEEYEEL